MPASTQRAPLALSLRKVLLLFLFLVVAACTLRAEEPEGKAVGMDTMTWYHPLLTPGVGDITFLCTVVSVERGPDRYGSPYWYVRLRVDERIFISKQYEERMTGVAFIDAGDFRRRKVGDRIVFFGGLGEKYEGEDFLKPCWSGTTTDLGILLHPPDSRKVRDNERLLQSFRAEAKGAKIDAASLKTFAAFCPEGAARYIHLQKQMKKVAREEGWPTAPAENKK